MQQETDQSYHIQSYRNDYSMYDIVKKKTKLCDRKEPSPQRNHQALVFAQHDQYQILNGRKIPIQFLKESEKDEESIRDHREKEFERNMILKQKLVPPQLLNKRHNITID